MRLLVFLVVLCFMFLIEGTRAEPPASRPKPAFSGCDVVEAEFQKAREGAGSAPVRKIDPLTKREFAATSSKEIESLDLPNGINCWAQIDGIWREDISIALDRTVSADGWKALTGPLEGLGTSVYTTPRYLVIDVSENGNVLTVNFGPAFNQTQRYKSRDGVPLSDVLKKNGKTKRYTSVNDSVSQYDAAETIVDVTRTGYARIRVDGVSFLRPRPGISRNAWSEQISDRDPFMIGFTMENLTANRRGYDIAFQDPDRFLNNPKAEVFRRVSRGYTIDEKRIIPLGMKIVKEDVQGMVHYTSMTSSETGFQEKLRSAYGAKVSTGMETDVGNIGMSAGANVAREKFSELKQNNYVGEESGYMRFKKYGLVTDHAYAQLSDAFIDAIEDARLSGDYYPIIEKFGTHYPYAVTYGAAGKVTQYITKSGFFRATGRNRDREETRSISLGVIDVETMNSAGKESRSSIAVDNEYGERIFSAVGGNGSWNDSGFSAGEAHYPILADLRPLSDLLSPIYFADEPEIYLRVKGELADAIGEYLFQYATLSNETLLPDSSDYVAIDGCWAFTDRKGAGRRNMITLRSENSISARSSDDQKEFLYREITLNKFRAKTSPATYEFLGNDAAVWRSNDKARLIYRLRWVGEFC